MSKYRRCFRIGLGYKCAPETFYILLMQPDGTYKKLDIDTSRYMWGYWLATGEKEKATAEVIRFLRKRTKMQKRLVTYGYYFKNSSNRYVYNGNYLSCADEYNISEKLALYKANKRYWIECGCRHHTGTTACLNGKYEVECRKEDYEEVDLTRPIKVYVNLK